MIEQRDWLNHIEKSQLESEKMVLMNTVKLSRPDTATFII